MKAFALFIISALMLISSAAHGADQRKREEATQLRAEVRTVIEAFVREQTRDLPGQVNIKVKEIDRRIKLTPCTALEAFLPAGRQLLGNSSIGVRCTAPATWSIFVPTQIRVSAELLTASRPLRQGETLRAEDLSTQHGELSGTGVLTDAAQAIGKVIKFNVGAGQILKQDMLRTPHVVTQGQTVSLEVREQGLLVRSEGQALSNASEGDSLQVRTPSGKIVQGIARKDGSIDVQPPGIRPGDKEK